MKGNEPVMEKRVVKLQIMLNDSELEAIDDWRFENRAASRSAAVRALIFESLERWQEGHAEDGKAAQAD
jgi:metal-responsive CopG/Arc/MetJ family transcriptional regulator